MKEIALNWSSHVTDATTNLHSTSHIQPSLRNPSRGPAPSVFHVLKCIDIIITLAFADVHARPLILDICRSFWSHTAGLRRWVLSYGRLSVPELSRCYFKTHHVLVSTSNRGRTWIFWMFRVVSVYCILCAGRRKMVTHCSWQFKFKRSLLFKRVGMVGASGSVQTHKEVITRFARTTRLGTWSLLNQCLHSKQKVYIDHCHKAMENSYNSWRPRNTMLTFCPRSSPKSNKNTSQYPPPPYSQNWIISAVPTLRYTDSLFRRAKEYGQPTILVLFIWRRDPLFHPGDDHTNRCF